MALKKTTKSIFWLSIGVLSITLIDLFTYKNTSTTPQSTNDSYEDNSHQRVNYHLDHLTRKIQLQKLKTTFTVEEVEGLKSSHPKLHADHASDSHQTHQQKPLENARYSNLTDQIDTHLNQIEIKGWMEAVQAQEDEKYRKEMIKSYQERARQAGFEMIIKDNQIVGVRKNKLL